MKGSASDDPDCDCNWASLGGGDRSISMVVPFPSSE